MLGWLETVGRVFGKGLLFLLGSILVTLQFINCVSITLRYHYQVSEFLLFLSKNDEICIPLYRAQLCTMR